MRKECVQYNSLLSIPASLGAVLVRFHTEALKVFMFHFSQGCCLCECFLCGKTMAYLRLSTVGSFLLVKTLKMIESNVSWLDSAMKCSPCPCSSLDLPIVCSALGLYLLQVEPYL